MFAHEKPILQSIMEIHQYSYYRAHVHMMVLRTGLNKFHYQALCNPNGL